MCLSYMNHVFYADNSVFVIFGNTFFFICKRLKFLVLLTIIIGTGEF